MKVRRLLLLCLWGLSLIGISFYGGAVSYGFFFGVTFIPVISLIYLAAVYLRFKIYQEIESRKVICGQPASYFFVLQNDDHFAFSSVSVRLFSSFSYVEELPDGVEYELLPGDKFTYRTKLVCKYRGEYEVGVKKIIITDFFRIFQITYSLPETIKATVLPKIVYVKALSSIEDIAVFMQRESPDLAIEPDMVVRDYVAGDPIRQIHWKSTAKEQKLKVRTLIGEEKKGISILCDTKRYSKDNKEFLPLENKMLEVMLALGIFFSEKGMAFTTYYSQNGILEHQVNGMTDFENFYNRSSDISFTEEENMQELLMQMVDEGSLYHSKVIFCVIHSIDDTIMELTGQLTESGVIVVLYVVTGQSVENYLKQSSERRRIVVIPIEAELEGRL